MATLISRATGNFTAAGTWEVGDTTSYLDSNAASTAISTSNLDSAAFTPGAITVSGIALKIKDRASSPSGTFTVTLRNSTAGTDLISVTVNVSDLPYYANTGNAGLGFGWVFFKFSSSQLLLAATNYLVRVVCSTTGSQVTLWRNGTANNWCRVLATTTTAAPASGDQLLITGERLSAGSGNAFTVTLDNTATTSFGPTVSGGPPEGIVVSHGGTFNCTNAAATAYYLKWKGIFHITGGGTVQFGVSGTPIVAGSSLTLYMDCVANLDSGIVVDSGGTFTAQGATKLWATTLQANSIASATVLTVASTSGWEASDVLGIGPGNVAITEFQQITVSSVDSATQVTTGAVTHAKRGSSPHFTEIINLTRNIKMTSASTTLRGYLSFREVCTATLRYVEMERMGAAYTNQGKMWVDIQQYGAGTVTMDYCVWKNFTSGVPGMYIHTSKTGSFYCNYAAIYAPGNRFLYSNGSSLANMELLNPVIIGDIDGAVKLEFNLAGRNWKYNGLVTSGGTNTSSSIGFRFNLGNYIGIFDLTGKMDNQRHTYQGSGLEIQGNGQNAYVGTIPSLQAYMNATAGLYLYTGQEQMKLKFTDLIAFGNLSTGAVRLHSFGNNVVEVTFVNALIAGHSMQNQARGLYLDSRRYDLRFENSNLGVVSGSYLAHTTADIDTGITGGSSVHLKITSIDTKFGSTNKIQTLSTHTLYDIRHQKYANVTGDNRRDVKVTQEDSWTSRLDTTVFNTASPSEKLTPTIPSTTQKGQSAPFFVRITSGAAKTIAAYVRKSSSGAGDSASYTGAEPRLIAKANSALGFDSDVVLDTAAAAIGTWEQLTGTTVTPAEDGILECYIDFDGSAGFINVDDWSAS